MKIMKIVRQSWRGEQSLALVFWGYFVGFSVGFQITFQLLVSVLPKSLTLFIYIPATLFFFPYIVWIFVSLWRCAKNSRLVWKVLVRIFVAIHLLLPVAWVVIVLIGSLKPYHFDVSVPQGIPVEAEGEISNETIHLKFSQLEFSAQVQNYRYKNSGPSKPFGVYLGMQTTNETFSLDPALVFIKTDDGKTINPLTFMGPSDPWQSPRAAAMGCGPRRYSLGWAISRIDVSLEDVKHGNVEKGVFLPAENNIYFQGNNCFIFWFDVESSPDRPLVLSVRGIKKNGKPLAVPDILFIKGSVRKYFSSP